MFGFAFVCPLCVSMRNGLSSIVGAVWCYANFYDYFVKYGAFVLLSQTLHITFDISSKHEIDLYGTFTAVELKKSCFTFFTEVSKYGYKPII